MSTHRLTRLLILALTLLPGPAYPKGPEAAGRPGTDRYGDPLPPGAVARLGTTRLRPGDSRAPFALSPDGKILATGEGDRLQLWDLATGKEIREFELPEAVSTESVIFSPDGKRFAAVVDHYGTISRPTGSDYSVFVGTVAGGKVRRQSRGAVASVAFLAGGRLLAGCEGRCWSGDVGSVFLWDAASGKEIRRFPEVISWAFTPDGKTLAGGRKDGEIRVWDVASGRERCRLRGHRDSVFALAFSPDGRTLASGGGKVFPSHSLHFGPSLKKAEKQPEPDTTVRLWDVGRARQRSVCGQHPINIESLRFSPDGRVLASADICGYLCIWDADTGKRLWGVPKTGPRELSRYFPFVFTFAPDGKTLVWSRKDGVLHRSDVATGRELRRWGGDPEGVRGLAFSQDGRVLISRGSSLRVWDPGTGKELYARDAHRTAVGLLTFSPDGKRLASQDSTDSLRLWETMTGKLVPLANRPDQVLHFALSADGTTLTAVGPDAMARVWEVSSGREVRRFGVGTADTIRAWEKSGPCLLFGPGARTLAVVGEDQVIRQWESATGKEMCRLRGHRRPVRKLSISSTGRNLVSLSPDRAIRLWDLTAGKEIHQFAKEGVAKEEDSNGRFAFSQDGRLLAWAWRKKIHLWDVAAGKEVGRLTGHPGGVQCLAFAQDGTTLASGGKDETTRVWDTASGRELWRLTGGEGEFGETEVFTSPDGRLLGLASANSKDSRRSLWDLATARKVCVMNWGDTFALTPDGRILARRRDAIELREMATGEVVGSIPKGHRGGVSSLAFSPDGRLLASGGADAAVIVWDWMRFAGLTQDGRPDAPEETLWADLSGKDARKAYRAMGSLAARRDRAVAFLAKRLRPASGANGDRVRRLLADLDSDRFAVRQRASRELANQGAEVQAFLWRALAAKPSLEVRRRIEAILADPALRQWSSGALRDIRAVQALEIIGSPAARRLLRSLAGGVPDSCLTQEAKRALTRLSRR